MSAKKRRSDKTKKRPPADAVARDPDAGKRLVTGIYRSGARTLFVPAVKMLDARPMFVDPKFQRSGRPNISAIEAQVGTGGRGTLGAYRTRYKAVKWYWPWQADQKELPKDVRAPGKAEIEHAKAAWDYGTILGTSIARYHEWFTETSRFPVEQIAEIMIWLFGGGDPGGWLILPEWVHALRNELTISALCGAADLDRSAVKAWKQDPTRRQALVDAITACRAGLEKPRASEAWERVFGAKSKYRHGRALPVDVVEEARRRLGEGEADAAVASALGIHRGTCCAIRNGSYQTKNVHGWTLKMADSMIAIGKAARESAAIERVRENLGTCGSINRLRARAERLGMRDALDNYINEGIAGMAKEHDVAENGGWNRRGVVAPGLYLPLPVMFDFQSKASRLWAAHKMSALRSRFSEVPECFVLWFLDWTLPLLRCSEYRDSVGLKSIGLTPFRNDPNAKAIAAAAARAETNGGPGNDVRTSPAGVENLPPAGRRKRGPPRKPENIARDREICRRWYSGEYKDFGEVGRSMTPPLKRQRVKQIVDDADPRSKRK